MNRDNTYNQIPIRRGTMCSVCLCLVVASLGEVFSTELWRGRILRATKSRHSVTLSHLYYLPLSLLFFI